MRLIDADRLIDYWKPDHDRTFTADYFIHTIEAQPTVSQWIPCSERLPEDGEYLATWTGRCGSLEQKPIISIFARYDGEWDMCEVYAMGYEDIKIMAWQPLPSPYKEDTK